jgi:hypothetical protein
VEKYQGMADEPAGHSVCISASWSVRYRSRNGRIVLRSTTKIGPSIICQARKSSQPVLAPKALRRVLPPAGIVSQPWEDPCPRFGMP